MVYPSYCTREACWVLYIHLLYPGGMLGGVYPTLLYPGSMLGVVYGLLLYPGGMLGVLLSLLLYPGGMLGVLYPPTTRFTVGQRREDPPSTRFTVGLAKSLSPYPFHCWARKSSPSPPTRFTVGLRKRTLGGILHLPTMVPGRVSTMVYMPLSQVIYARES